MDDRPGDEGPLAAKGRGRGRPWRRIAALGVLDVFAVGAGMGVPVFAIALGFAAGWWLARRLGLRRALAWSAGLAGLTFVMMALIWGPQLTLLADPAFDAAAWGIPLVLYTSRPSFLAWEAAMIVGGPVLQFMACATTTALVVAARPGAGD